MIRETYEKLQIDIAVLEQSDIVVTSTVYAPGKTEFDVGTRNETYFDFLAMSR